MLLLSTHFRIVFSVNRGAEQENEKVKQIVTSLFINGKSYQSQWIKNNQGRVVPQFKG